MVPRNSHSILPVGVAAYVGSASTVCEDMEKMDDKKLGEAFERAFTIESLTMNRKL